MERGNLFNVSHPRTLNEQACPPIQICATVISMFLSVQYAVIMVMLCVVFLKYGVSEFYRVLLSAVLVDLYGVADRKHIRKIYKPRSIKMEPMMKNTSNVHHGVNTLG